MKRGRDLGDFSVTKQNKKIKQITFVGRWVGMKEKLKQCTFNLLNIDIRLSLGMLLLN
jgi:hypothetical protein